MRSVALQHELRSAGVIKFQLSIARPFDVLAARSMFVRSGLSHCLQCCVVSRVRAILKQAETSMRGLLAKDRAVMFTVEC